MHGNQIYRVNKSSQNTIKTAISTILDTWLYTPATNVMVRMLCG